MTIAWLAISAIGELSEKAKVMSVSAKHALLAALASQDVVALNRAQFRTALDPSYQNRLAERDEMQTQLMQYDKQIAQVSKTTDERAKAMLPEIAKAFAAYKTEFDGSLAAIGAEKVNN